MKPFTRDPEEARRRVCRWYYRMADREGRAGSPDMPVQYQGLGAVTHSPKPAGQEKSHG